MILKDLLQKLIEITDAEEEADDYEIYFQHGERTYSVTDVAFDADEDIDITLVGKWENPR